MSQTAWIAVDWGTTRLRFWVLDAAGDVIGQGASDRGMGSLAPADFETALLELIAPFLAVGRKTPVLACGMAGARQGWAEAPYAAVPCPPPAGQAVPAPTTDPRLDVRILPGLCQLDPPDVMRGEETQIAGFLAGAPGFDGVLCLPGTHCKWVRVAQGQVRSFRTAMTGEIFDLLGHRSILRLSMDDDWDDSVFADAVVAAHAHPEEVFSRLFSLRAQSLLPGSVHVAPRARLSGFLIGAELAAMQDAWQDRRIAVIGAPELARRYQAALAAIGVQAELADGTKLVLAGLASAYAQLEDRF